VTVRDALGRAHREQQLAPGATQVELAGLAPGLYWLQLKNGPASQTLRLVVQ